MKKGFTLIELLIVIAILGILIALILPRFADIRTDANTKVCTGNLRGLANAMATYETKGNTSVSWTGQDPDVLVTWGYVSTEPHCPYTPTGNYGLVTAAGNAADYATCPNVTTYSDHKWP